MTGKELPRFLNGGGTRGIENVGKIAVIDL